MSNFSGLAVMGGHNGERRVVNGEVVKFKYPAVFACHYRYRGSVENHNSLRHNGRTKYKFGLESIWVTTWLPILVFAFFVACTEVNSYLAMKYFLKTDDKFMNF